MTTRNPDWLLSEIRRVVDDSDLDVKGLAIALGVSHPALCYWLDGSQQWPLIRLRQAAEALGPVHGRRLLEVVAGEDWIIGHMSQVKAAEPAAEDLRQAGARSMAAEGRFVDRLCRALADNHLSEQEIDDLIRDANDLESLIEGIKARIRGGTKR